MSNLIFASVISEIQQSDIFMTVKARICEAPQANLNGARVTEAFIDEIVSNERYVGLPLYADKKALIGGNYTRLGHLYDVKTGEFHSTQIGSFYKFEKQVKGENVYLVGYARIPKRNKKLSKAISELFTEGALKFSFELSVGEYEELDDDTILIDASENNYLEGTAIVTYPACEDAVALELVAQKADETERGESEMAEVENMAEVVETEAEQLNAEEEKVEEVSEEETEETADCKKKKNGEEETASVCVTNIESQTSTTYAYDTETGKDIAQTVTVETRTTQEIEGTLVESVDGIHVAEADGDGGTTEGGTTEGNTTEGGTTEGGTTESGTTESDPEPDPIPEETDQDSYDPRKLKKTAEEMIAELMETVKSLQAEIEELKQQKETKAVTGEINPFMSDINSKGKYTLLEKDTTKKQYTLI